MEEPQDTWAYSATSHDEKAHLVGAALLCGVVHAEPILNVKAAEIHEGDTAYIANNSIWFTNEEDLAVWKCVRQVFAPKDVEAYQSIILEVRQAWQFIAGPLEVKVISYDTERHQMQVKMITKGRFEGADWWVDGGEGAPVITQPPILTPAATSRSGSTYPRWLGDFQLRSPISCPLANRNVQPTVGSVHCLMRREVDPP